MDFDEFDDLFGDDDEAMMAELEAAAIEGKVPVAVALKQREEQEEQEDPGFDEDEEAEAMLREMENM